PRARRRLERRLDALPLLAPVVPKAAARWVADEGETGEAGGEEPSPSPASRLALLEASAGAPVSPARMSPPRPLLLRRRRVVSASARCSWSTEVFRRGNGSDIV